MEVLCPTDIQASLGTTCRIEAGKQHVRTVADSVSIVSETFSRVAHNSVSRQPMQLVPPHQPNQPSLSRHPALNGPWTTEDDEILCDYRARGFGWAQIQEEHFPGKSANACRKRHERLMTRRRDTYWDECRLERLAVNYHQMREQIWGPLADKLGEKWENIEKACMQQGLKGLKCQAANHQYRKQSSISSSSKVGNFSASDNENWHRYKYDGHGSDDDSGICLEINRRDREVQKARSNPSNPGYKFSSLTIDGAGPSDVVTRSTTRDSQHQKESSSRIYRVERAAEEAHLKFSQSKSAFESAQSSRPLLSPGSPSHTAHPIQEHSRQPPLLERPRELRPPEEAVHKNSAGRSLYDPVVDHGGHQPPSPPPPEGKNSIFPSNLGQAALAMHASEAPGVQSLRGDAEDKLAKVEGRKIELNSIPEYNESLGEGVAATNEENWSLKRQMQHLESGTSPASNDNSKEGNDGKNVLANFQERSELSQKKAHGQEESAKRIQALWDRDRQTWDAKRHVLDTIGEERDQVRSGLVDVSGCLKSPPKVLSLSPQTQHETPPMMIVPQCDQRRRHPSRRSTSISECMEDSRHRCARLLVDAQMSPNSPEALDIPRAECSPWGFTSESERSFTDSVGSYAAFGTGCDELNGVLQELHEALVHELVQDYMFPVQKPGHRAQTLFNSAASSNSNTESRTGDSALSEPSSAAKGRLKRRRDDEDDGGNDEDEDENSDRRRHKRQGTTGSNSDVIPEKLFACPYFKLDPPRYSQRNITEKKYRGCSSCYLMDISRLKQHLYRVHGRPDHYCGSCFQEFKTRMLLDAHMRQRPSCKLSECPFDEKMDSDQKIKIKRKRFGQKPYEAWYDIWRILFPDSDEPESPFSEITSTIAVQSLFEHFRTRAPLMLSRLVRARIQGSIILADYEQLLLQNAQEEAMAEVIQTFRGEFEDLESSMTTMSSSDRSLCKGRCSTSSESLPVSVLPVSDQSTFVNPIPLHESVLSAANGASLGADQQLTIEYRSSQSPSLPTLGLSLTHVEATGPNWYHTNKPSDADLIGKPTEQTGADALARSRNNCAQQPDVVDHEHLWHVSSAIASVEYPWFDGFSSSSHHMHSC